MTVAIGLVCKDGVLVAADSMGSSQNIAMRVPKVHKFANNPVVWTASGSQYVLEEVEAAVTAKFDDKAMDLFTEPKTLLLRTKLREQIVPTMPHLSGWGS